MASDSSGALTVTLNQAANYDQAELVEDPGTTAVESWIPENRLGRVDWFITDHLGSTKLLVSQDGSSRYMGDDDPFGNNLRSMGDSDNHQYTGQVLDINQNLYYFGARYYDPEVGRFLSGDPLSIVGNFYLYCTNMPLSRVDPDGKADRPYTVYLYETVIRDGVINWVPKIPIQAHYLDSLGITVYEVKGHPDMFNASILGANRGNGQWAIDTHNLSNNITHSSDGNTRFTASLTTLIAWDKEKYYRGSKGAFDTFTSGVADAATFGTAGPAEKGVKGAFVWFFDLLKPTHKNPLGLANTANTLAHPTGSDTTSKVVNTTTSLLPVVGTIKTYNQAVADSEATVTITDTPPGAH